MARTGAGSVRSVNYATSPLLASKTPPWRSRFVVALVGGAFAVLLGRAVWLQILHTDFYQAQGEKRFVHKEALPASRGRILDRNGLVLATSVALPSVQVDGKNFAADTAQRKSLARLVNLSPKELDERLAALGAGTLVLRRQLEEAQWQQIKALGVKGLQEVREFKRRYPEGESAAHVVGFTDIDGKGIDGIERSFQPHLLGQVGQRTVLRDRLGRVVEGVGDTAEPVHGDDVTLSIDSKVQFFAYQRVRDAVREHKAAAGSVVVLDTQTGEVLALANFPSYDPSQRANLTGAQLRNRAVTDVFEPGSTMKPLVAAQALESGRVRVDTVINTAPGSLVVGPLVVKDAHPHAALTVQQVIQKSSNVGAARMAMQMPARELWELFSTIGYGQKPQLDFPGVVTGRLKPYKKWRPVEQATMAYGYGLSASLLQMARAYTPLARDGDVIPVSLMRQEQPVTGVRVFSPTTAAEIRKMLQMAASPGGTGQKAQTIGYSVGGKSGTAHKQEGKGYASNKYRSWFVGMAPISAPRIIVAVMVDEPSNGLHYGGDVAAPVFSQVVQQTLRMMNVAPDLDVKAHISARSGPLPTTRVMPVLA
ncbi:MAG TPA: penicillin-binding protein 2, partial [Rubrivivax sp.]|nr:penicillin-binding protein 2 [Rubrivivax sp.]